MYNRISRDLIRLGVWFLFLSVGLHLLHGEVSPSTRLLSSLGWSHSTVQCGYPS